MVDGTRKHRMLVGSLNLIPYFQSHPGASLMEAATDLGMDVEEVRDSLAQLFCSGVGRNTEELIDLTFSYRDGVTISEDQGLNKPLRLTATEAAALLLTLEALESTPGLVDRRAVQSAAAKLREITDTKTRGVYDSIAKEEPESVPTQQVLSRAINDDRRVQFAYWSGRNESWSHRVVDPARLFLVEETAYLIAWEDGVEDHRTFRLDRMKDVELLDEPSRPHLNRLHFDPADPFNFKAADRADLTLAAEATWLADFAELSVGEKQQDGRFTATMPLQSTDWAERFVLGQADRVDVVAPNFLRKAVANRAAAGLDRYTH